MNASKPIRSLSRLVDLREREVDRLSADMAAKARVRERYRNNLDRLDQLYQGAGASGSLQPVLSLNCAAYKQSVMQLAEEHRQDLTLHEADMAVTQRALAEASGRHESLGHVLERKREQVRRMEAAAEQKRQDDLATQVWFRGCR